MKIFYHYNEPPSSDSHTPQSFNWRAWSCDHLIGFFSLYIEMFTNIQVKVIRFTDSDDLNYFYVNCNIYETNNIFKNCG